MQLKVFGHSVVSCHLINLFVFIALSLKNKQTKTNNSFSFSNVLKFFNGWCKFIHFVHLYTQIYWTQMLAAFVNRFTFYIFIEYEMPNHSYVCFIATNISFLIYIWLKRVRMEMSQITNMSIVASMVWATLWVFLVYF